MYVIRAHVHLYENSQLKIIDLFCILSLQSKVRSIKLNPDPQGNNDKGFFMNKLKLKTASAKIKKQRENLDKTLSDIIQAIFNDAGREWLERFPKRKLELVSGMGSVFWVIDGEILQHDFENGYDSDYRLKYSSKANARIQLKRYWITKRELFLPLLEALEFLGEVLENHECDSHYLIDIKF